MWCLLSAPLLIGCDLEQLDPFTIGLLSNDEVLALDQDALGKQAVRVATLGQVDVFWERIWRTVQRRWDFSIAAMTSQKSISTNWATSDCLAPGTSAISGGKRICPMPKALSS
jgi:hypothetical protein